MQGTPENHKNVVSDKPTATEWVVIGALVVVTLIGALTLLSDRTPPARLDSASTAVAPTARTGGAPR